MLNNFKKSNKNNRFQKNIFNIKKSKLEEFGKFDFDRGLVSINDKENMFINYFKYNDEQGYEMIEDYYINFLYGDYSFLNDFEIDYLRPSDRVDRLLQIIKNIQGIKYKKEDLQYILKLNNLKDKRIHFFVRVNKNNLSLLLIDIYHLAIYGEHYINGKFQHNSIEKTYKRYKNNEISLEELKNGKNSKPKVEV